MRLVPSAQGKEVIKTKKGADGTGDVDRGKNPPTPLDQKRTRALNGQVWEERVRTRRARIAKKEGMWGIL